MGAGVGRTSKDEGRGSDATVVRLWRLLRSRVLRAVRQGMPEDGAGYRFRLQGRSDVQADAAHARRHAGIHWDIHEVLRGEVWDRQSPKDCTMSAAGEQTRQGSHTQTKKVNEDVKKCAGKKIMLLLSVVKWHQERLKKPTERQEEAKNRSTPSVDRKQTEVIMEDQSETVCGAVIKAIIVLTNNSLDYVFAWPQSPRMGNLTNRGSGRSWSCCSSPPSCTSQFLRCKTAVTLLRSSWTTTQKRPHARRRTLRSYPSSVRDSAFRFKHDA